MTIYSSRNQSCVHPIISTLGNKNEACRLLNKKKTENIENPTESSIQTTVSNYVILIFILFPKF